MPRKGTRRIVVDGVPYRWRHRARITCAQGAMPWGGPLTCTIERESGPGRLLVVTFGDRRPQDYCCPYCTPAGPLPEGITPSRVAEAIRRALTEGWNPDGPSGRFELDQRAQVSSEAVPGSVPEAASEAAP